LITAKPDAHSLFGGWTVTTSNSSIAANREVINFIMESGLSITADFETNIYLGASGIYNGLFVVSNNLNNVTEDTAGLIGGLVVRTNGNYSGRLWIDGVGHSISGVFDAYGNATNKVSRPGEPVLVEMTLDASTNPPQIFGTVSGTNQTAWTAELVANRAANNLPAADYTMLIPPGTNAPPTNSPGGYGYALISTSAGNDMTPNIAKISGGLADGTTFSQTVPVSQDGYVPIYANLYASKGLLLGWINLTNAAMSLAWVHPTVHSGLFTGAFTTTNQIALSPWTNPPAISALPTNLVVVETTGNNPVQTNNFTITITNGTFNFGKLSGPAMPLSGSIATKTGLLEVTFGSGASKTTGHGAIWLNGTNGGGYFLTKTNAGAILLQP
jgi:hypothetical protein